MLKIISKKSAAVGTGAIALSPFVAISDNVVDVYRRGPNGGGVSQILLSAINRGRIYNIGDVNRARLA